MKRPSFFFNSNSGGCGCGSVQTGNSVPCATPSGALICDNRYYGLQEATDVQLLGVPSGGNCQAFLKGGVSARGFIFYTDGKVSIVSAPQLSLPVLNPLASGSYPFPGAFQFLAIATGGDPLTWKHVAAPTVGSWVLQSINGSWELTDAGTIPGIQAIGASSLTVVKGGVVALTDISGDGSGVWALRRMAGADKRVMVYDVDAGTGEAGWKALAAGSYLEHPKAKFTELLCRTFSTVDLSGTEIAGGLEQLVTYGVGAITDGVRPVYSPSAKRFMRAAPNTLAQYKVDTNIATAETTSYALMPGGHGQAASLNFNYPTVRVDFGVKFASAAGVSLALFRDGGLVQEYATDSATDISLVFIDTTNPLGSHTYDVRFKASGGAGTVGNILYSNLTITTLQS